MAHTFNFGKFLRAKWGDPDRLIAFLHAYGHKEIERATVNQWFRRESIPAEKFAMLLGLLKIETGSDVAIEEYLR